MKTAVKKGHTTDHSAQKTSLSQILQQVEKNIP